MTRSGFNDVSLSSHDAVHGSIDTRDITPGAVGVIGRLLASSELDRLRRIRLLGFASRRYVAADHNRYAHALGSMQMMRALFERLRRNDGSPLREPYVDLVKQMFPKVGHGGGDIIDNIGQHLMVGALLQDLGELPYSRATRYVYTPSDSLRNSVARGIGVKRATVLKPKQVFTAKLVQNLADSGSLGDMDPAFLLFLITGHTHLDKAVEAQLKPFLHMMDGVVDADRLDYVFRDAYHTIGQFGRPDDVVQALVGYTDDGPVFSDPSPVAAFLAMRAHLHWTVYLSSENRLKAVLLTTLLKGIARVSKRCRYAKKFFSGRPLGWELEIHDLRELDDETLANAIRGARGESALRSKLDENARIAMDVFVDSHPYTSTWLPTTEATSNNLGPGLLRLPPELFWDNFPDLLGPLYEADTVFIKSERYKRLGKRDLVSLADCGGPFDLAAREETGLKPPGALVMLFEPVTPMAGSSAMWDDFNNAVKDGSARYHLLQQDPYSRLFDPDLPPVLPPDTYDDANFKAPRVFVSFSGSDEAIVRIIQMLLYKRKQKYVVLLHGGFGRGPRATVAEKLMKTDVVLMAISDNYIEGWANKKSYLHDEIKQIEKLVPPIVTAPIPLHPYSTSFATFRSMWKKLGHDEAPWLGDENTLREQTWDELEGIVTEAIGRAADGKTQPRATSSK